jgi:hypothetical protein
MAAEELFMSSKLRINLNKSEGKKKKKKNEEKVKVFPSLMCNRVLCQKHRNKTKEEDKKG